MEQLTIKKICLICETEKETYQMVLIYNEYHCPKCALKVTNGDDDE